MNWGTFPLSYTHTIKLVHLGAHLGGWQELKPGDIREYVKRQNLWHLHCGSLWQLWHAVRQQLGGGYRHRECVSVCVGCVCVCLSVSHTAAFVGKSCQRNFSYWMYCQTTTVCNNCTVASITVTLHVLYFIYWIYARKRIDIGFIGFNQSL